MRVISYACWNGNGKLVVSVKILSCGKLEKKKLTDKHALQSNYITVGDFADLGTILSRFCMRLVLVLWCFRSHFCILSFVAGMRIS